MKPKFVVKVLASGIDVEGPGAFQFHLDFSEDWKTASVEKSPIQRDINQICQRIEAEFPNENYDESAVEIYTTPEFAKALKESPEYRAFTRGAPDALAAITDRRNPNRVLAMVPYLYGIPLKIEGLRYPDTRMMRILRNLRSEVARAVQRMEEECDRLLKEDTEPVAVFTFTKPE